MSEVYKSSYLLAGKLDVTEAVLEQLTDSESSHVRARVAEHPRNTLALAMKLLRDKAVDVRIALTDNTQLLPFIAPDLARDESSDVRFALAENLCAPLSVLEQLSLDENPYVANRALQTIERAVNVDECHCALAA